MQVRTARDRVLLLGLLACMGPVFAEVQMTTAVRQVVTRAAEDGAAVRELVEVAQVVAGDTLQYTISFTNKGTNVIEGGSIVITNPLPPDTVYIDGTARGSGTRISYSVDGGTTFESSAELKVLRDGAPVPAQAADYTTIRWTFTEPLEAGGTGDVSFSVRVK